MTTITSIQIMSNIHEKAHEENEELLDTNPSDTKAIPEQKEHKGVYQQLFPAVFNFVNTSLGSGVLTLPYSFSVSGYGLGLFIVILFAVLSTISYYVLMIAANKVNWFQYDAISNNFFNKWVGYIAVTASMLFSWGCLISYVIVIRDNFFFFENLQENKELWSNVLLVAIMFLLILPLCFLPNLDNLKFNSYLIVGVILYLDFVCIYTFFSKLASGQLPEITPIKTTTDFIKALPLTTQAYNSHYNFLNIYKELFNRKKSSQKLVNYTIQIISIIYLSIGIFGYLSYGSNTKSNILVNLAKEPNIFANIANIGMIVLMVCHYPLPVYALRKATEQLIFKTENYDNKKISYLMCVIMIIIATVIGTFIEAIDDVLSFTSSLAGGTIGFIIPGVFLWKFGLINRDKKQLVGGIFLTVIGVIITGLGFGMAIYQLFEPKQ